MNQDIKQKWVAALRSGEYVQDTQHLRTCDGFCCLGVLSDLHVKETGTMSWTTACEGTFYELEDDHGSTIDDEHLLTSTTEWAQLDWVDPPVIYNDQVVSLSHLNDIKGLSFQQIADIIEEQL